MRRDPDGGKIETHIVPGGEIIFPNSRDSRFNAVSGGIKKYEEPEAAARREMQAELGEAYSGAGRLKLRDEFPLFWHGHKKGNTGYLSAVLIAEYYPEETEIELLNKKGKFWEIPTILHRLGGSDREKFRPAFAFALELLHAEALCRPYDILIADHKTQVKDAMLSRKWEQIVILVP